MKAEGLSKRLKVYRKILGFTPDELEGVILHAEVLERELEKAESQLEKENGAKPLNTTDLLIEKADKEIRDIALVLSNSNHGYHRPTLKEIQMHYVEIKKLWLTSNTK